MRRSAQFSSVDYSCIRTGVIDLSYTTYFLFPFYETALKTISTRERMNSRTNAFVLYVSPGVVMPLSRCPRGSIWVHLDCVGLTIS